MSQPLEAFFPSLMPRVAGCPEPVALQALRDAAMEFCDMTCIVVAVTEPQPTFLGQSRYTLALPTGTQVTRLLRAWMGKRELGVAQRAAQPLAAHENTSDATGTPSIVAMTAADTVNLLPAPDIPSIAPLAVQVALRPTPDATALADDLYMFWRDAVVGGALARIASTPGRPYSDANQAALGASMFNAGLSAARREFHRSRSAAPLVARMRPFA